MYLLVQGSMDIIQLHLGQGNPTPVQPTQEEILNHSAVAQGHTFMNLVTMANNTQLQGQCQVRRRDPMMQEAQNRGILYFLVLKDQESLQEETKYLMKKNFALKPTRLQSRRKFMTDLVSEMTLSLKFSTWITTKVVVVQWQ